MKTTKLKSVLITSLFVAAVTASQGAVVITEWMYGGASGEFIEFTNTGNLPVNFASWSFSDSATSAGQVDLSAFGLVAAGESVVLTEALDADFRLAWNLAASVKVIGGNLTNLGRADTINLYNATSALEDSLVYGDQVFAGSPRTQNRSGYTTPENWGTNNPVAWMLSTDGIDDAFTSTGLDVGSPGTVVPEASSLLLGAFGALTLLRRRR